MATAGPSHTEEDLFHCSICLDEFDDPRSLNCLHTFCLGCLENVAGRFPERRFIPCPFCQQESPLPETGVTGLKKDFKIEQMKELLDATKKTNEPVGGKLCDVCKGDDKKVAKLHCATCSVFFCEKCSEKHEENAVFDDHTLNAVQKIMEPCMVHVGHAVAYVCQCAPDTLLCALCIMDHDKEHEVETISEARVNLLMHTLGAVNEVKVLLQGRVDDVARMVNRYGSMLLNVEREIKAQAKLVVAEVTRKEHEMIKLAHATVKESLAKYQAAHTSTQLQYTQRVERYINQVIHRPDDTRYIKDANLQREFMRLKESIRPRIIPETGIVFVPHDTLPRIHLGALEGTREVKAEK